MMSNYGIIGSLYMLYCMLRTKIVYPNARIIRFPIDIRRKKNISIGNGFTTGKNCRIEVVLVDLKKKNDKLLKIGHSFQMNDHCHITASESVDIGNNVLLASKVYISDVSHGGYGAGEVHSDPEEIVAKRTLITAPVKINDNVWLGDGVCVLPGVTIGENSIIGANAVVTQNIPANSIAVGIPAKVIKRYNFEQKKWKSIKDDK